LGNVDAALVDLDGPDASQLVMQPGFWPWRPSEAPVAAIGHVGELLALLDIDSSPVYLYPPRMEGAPRRLRLTYLGAEFDQPVRYDRATVRVAEVLVFRPEGGATRPGFSGAAVVAGNLLVGMHIAGIDEAGLQRSHVLPAYQFLRGGIRGYRLELATDGLRE